MLCRHSERRQGRLVLGGILLKVTAENSVFHLKKGRGGVKNRDCPLVGVSRFVCLRVTTFSENDIL